MMVRRLGLVLPMLIAAGLIVGGTIKLASGSGRIQSPDPYCNEPPAMPAEKLRLLLEKCQYEQTTIKAPAKTSQAGGIPPEVLSRPNTPMVILMGINEGGPWPSWAKEGTERYAFKNTWSAANSIIYAGSTSDITQGVVVVADRFVQSEPQKLAVFLTQAQDGQLRFVAENGNILTLVAQNGVKYSFDVSQRKLARN
jgi:hypothetical protein